VEAPGRAVELDQPEIPGRGISSDRKEVNKQEHRFRPMQAGSGLTKAKHRADQSVVRATEEAEQGRVVRARF